MADVTTDSTRRLVSKKQTLDDAYAAPANFLEIDVVNPITHGVGNKRYTDYEVRMRVSNVTVPAGRRGCRARGVGVSCPPARLYCCQAAPTYCLKHCLGLSAH